VSWVRCCPGWAAARTTRRWRPGGSARPCRSCPGCPRTASATRSSTGSSTRASGWTWCSARYTFHVQGTADRLLTDPGPLPDEVTTLSLGTLSLVLEPGASAYEAVLRRESARGRLTVLDPNIRAGLIPDPAAYRARFATWLPDIGVLKVSVEDARWLADTSDIEPALRDWLAAGVTAIVLTRGSAGLTVLTGADRVDVPAVPARVVDTIGAGDTVHGALLAWLHRNAVRGAAELTTLDGPAWSDALGFAARAAAVTVGRVGAQPPYAAELN
jgi:fructokinase